MEKYSLAERIKLYYTTEGYELEPKDETVRKRWSMAFSLLSEAETREDIIQTLSIEFGISERTASNDIVAATNLFGDIERTSILGSLHITKEHALQAYRLAKTKGDAKGMNGAVSNIIKIIQLQMPHMKGLKVKLKQNNMIVTNTPEELGFKTHSEKELNALIEEFKIDEAHAEKIKRDAGIGR